MVKAMLNVTVEANLLENIDEDNPYDTRSKFIRKLLRIGFSSWKRKNKTESKNEGER